MRLTDPTVETCRHFSAASRVNGEQIASDMISFEEVRVKCEKEEKMSVRLQIEEMPDYLAARFTGVGAVEEVWRRFELIAEHCKRANKNKLLLDLSEAHAHAEVSLVDRYNFGEAAQIFTYYKLIKIAFVSRPEQLDPQRFCEMVAQNRGVNARVFTNAEDAEKWLLE